MQFLVKLQEMLDATRKADFLGPLALRLYLVPVFWVAGMNKLTHFDSIVGWFGSMGLPLPTLMAGLATGAEVIGAVALLIGLGVRWMSIPLMITMVVAVITSHLGHGWQAVADPSSPFAGENIAGAMQRLDKARELLREHGNYDWLTETGNFVISNNGFEWAATYFVMLLALFFTGAGKLSLDHYIAKYFSR